MSVYKKLAQNSIIFAIGNLGTKLITFILVPLYTYTLTTEQYGSTDIITTTINLLIPLISLSIYDAVLRFTMDKNYDRREVFTNGLIMAGIGILFSFLLFPILSGIQPFKHFIYYFYLLLIIQTLNTLFLQFARGIGKLKLFAVTGISTAGFSLLLSLLFLLTLDMGIEGYFLSLILANAISGLILFGFGSFKNYVSFRNVKFTLTKEMLIYCTPLIPNALMWWVMNASDRYMITFFIGMAANGLYAVANKIPSLLNIINSIFFQAWQLSAIEEADSESKSKFFTDVFSLISSLMFICTSFLLLSIKLIMKFFVADEYYIAWKYSPFLFLAVVFSCFSAFLGTNYIAAKDTKGVFKTSVVGAVIKVALSLMLIPLIGINGAAIATMVSFAVIWYIRMIDTRRFVHIKLNNKVFFLTLAMLFIQIGLLYWNISLEVISQILLFIFVILINKTNVQKITDRFKNLLLKKLRRSRSNAI